MPSQLGDTKKAVRKIRKAIRDGGDEMEILAAVDKALGAAGLPHVDPLYGEDPDDARVLLIYLTIAGKDWFPHHVGEIEDILEMADDELDHPEN